MQWEQEVVESKYAAGLQQLPEGTGRWGRKIPADASLWRCDETGTQENLWLNLGTGFIGSGREVGACWMRPGSAVISLQPGLMQLSPCTRGHSEGHGLRWMSDQQGPQWSGYEW